WRQRAASHDVLRADRMSGGVEVGQIAASHIHCTDAQTGVGVLGVDPVKVDERLETSPKRRRVVVASGFDRAGRFEPGIWESRREESRRTRSEGCGGADAIDERSRDVPTRAPETNVFVEAEGRTGYAFPEV